MRQSDAAKRLAALEAAAKRAGANAGGWECDGQRFTLHNAFGGGYLETTDDDQLRTVLRKMLAAGAFYHVPPYTPLWRVRESLRVELGLYDDEDFHPKHWQQRDAAAPWTETETPTDISN